MAQLSKQALIVENNSSFPNNTSNYITPAILRSYNTDIIDSLVDENTYNSDSASWNSKIVNVSSSTLITASVTLNTITFTKGDLTTFNITVNTGSGGGGTTDITSLNAFTASQQTQNATLAPVTASLITSASTSAAANALNVTKWNNIAAQSGSWGLASGSVPGGTISSSAQIVGLGFLQTSSFQTYTSSIDSKFTSVGASTSSLNTFSSSTAYSVLYLSQATQSLNASTQSLNSFTASAQISLNTLNSFTSSANTQLTNLSTSQSIDNTKWNNIAGQSGSWSGGTVSTGTVSSSAQILAYNIFATTGSNAFNGSQQITGSVGILGDVSMANTSVLSLAVIKSSTSAGLNISSSSGQVIATLGAGGGQQAQFQGQITAVGQISSSNYAGFGNATTYSASVDSRLSGLAAATSSYITTPLTSLNAYTASNDTKWTTLGGQSGSWITSTQTGSFATTGSNSFIGTEIITGSLIVSGSGTPLIVSGNIAQQGAFSFILTGPASKATLNQSSLIITSGSTIGAQTIATLNRTTGISHTSASNQIGIHANANFFGSYGPYPVIFLVSGSNSVTYNPIQFQAANAYTDGRTTFTTPIQALAGVEVTGSTNINQLTASLQQGYTWVGGTNNISTLVATSSFGSSINTGSFATTGSNTFRGIQTLNSGAVLPIGATLDFSQNGSATSAIRFFTTSSRWLNIQPVPYSGNSVAIADFPSDNHFMNFNMDYHNIQFTAQPLFDTSGSNGMNVTDSSTNNSPTINLQKDNTGNGAQYPIFNVYVDSQANAPNGVFGGFQIQDPGQSNYTYVGFAANSYTSEYSNETVTWFGGGGNNGAGSNTAMIMRTGSANLEIFKPTVFNYNAPTLLSGSASGSLISNVGDTFTGTAAVQNIITLTAAQYAGITPNSTTLYIVI